MCAGMARIEVYVDEERILSALREDVRRGLSSRPRSLPPKYFYDEEGSRLFTQITLLPEYYLTRVEIAILRRHSAEIVGINLPTDLVELGPGVSRKTRLLLGAMHRAGTLDRFVPVDISVATLHRIAEDLSHDYPLLSIHGIAGDFEQVLDRIPSGGQRLVVLLGSTIGNFDRAEAVSLLARISHLLEPSDLFLLGTDLVKDVPVLEAAYDDAAGVTARFNRNVLSVVNRRLGADFRQDLFDHRAFFNPEASRIEMHLTALKSHTVRIADLEMEVSIEAGETIHTENSYKYTRDGVTSMLTDAGLHLRRWYVDRANAFALSLAGRTP